MFLRISTVLLVIISCVQIVLCQDFEDVQPLLVDTLNTLRTTILNLQREESELVGEKDALKALLAGCNCDGRTPPPTPLTGCESFPPPCYPGTLCRQHPNGRIECGNCPSGFTGDGRTCRPVTDCSKRPCFQGVQCYDTATGFQCGPCPVGYHGNGVECRPERRYCDRNPCFTGVQCFEIDGGHRCGSCPRGYEGNGEQCRPERPRQRHCDRNPCFSGVQCFETDGGYRCGPCPRGYEGNGEQCRLQRYCDRNPCFAGVQCFEIDGGHRCAACPQGYEGNGEQCRPERRRHCDSSPCYIGVSCSEVEGGFRCGPCPVGYEGDGQRCREVRACASNPCSPGGQCYERPPQGYECICNTPGYEGDSRRCWRVKPCENQEPGRRPCAPGVQCRNTEVTPYFLCGECPQGSTGNGITCTDINECDEKPCDPRVHCTNLSPGFKCDGCPPGFTGHRGFEGVGVEFARRNKQRCQDIDECKYDNGGCDKETMRCVNTEGSYKCEYCEWKETSPARKWPFNFT